MEKIIEEMVEAGVHYGHQTRKWNPKMKPYLLKDKEGIYLINLEETSRLLGEAAKFISKLVSQNKKILFVGCKRQAQESIREIAEQTDQFFVNHRWLGGTLTNLTTIRNSVARLEYLEKIEKAAEFKQMSKKELASLNREKNKLLRNLQGIRTMEKLPDALFVVDSARESIAVSEAKRLKVPVIAIVDTNADPNQINFPIPGNDDSSLSISLILKQSIREIIPK